MYRIGKTFGFEAAHRLPLPPTHKCSRLHGHSYRAEVILGAEQLDANGFVIDFGELDPVKAYLAEQLDHRDLGVVVAVPSSENIARHLYDWCTNGGLLLPNQVRIEAIRVSETESTWAEYGPDEKGRR
ncbi:6-pyruvoyl trahydropterin synthase family protein [Plantactinospora sp. CA-290183]|uniref:6-pyruvoyl trahydropterin synthase family protein n=1 Tax=Plantactinospora sp. CA-290183 TaxID=3240006 RepID=UPI003D8D5AC0